MANNTKVVTTPVRISYAHIFEPVAIVEGAKAKYSVSLLIPKTNTELVKKINDAIDAAIEKGTSIGIFTMIFNIFIAVFGGGILFGSWEVSMYTLIRIIITSMVIDRVHTSYNYVRLDIISENVKDIASRLMEELGRGVTLMNVEGAYTHKQKQDAFIIITRYELAKAKRICLECDPKVFIIIAPARGTVGRFIKKAIM